MKIHLFILVSLVTAIGCGQTKHPNTDSKQDSTAQATAGPKAGEIVVVESMMDPLQHYACYLPIRYKDGNRYPVVFWFDSKGNGVMPLEMYSAIADSLDVIMVGSMNSKNGLKPTDYVMITAILVEDVLQRFTIDTSRMLAGGFSGGARVAGNLVYEDRRFRGVLYNGAGPDPAAPAHVQNLSMACLGGMDDFNLAEMQESMMKVNCKRKWFQTYQAGHEWASAADVYQALQFLWNEKLGEKKDFPLSAVMLKSEREVQNQFREQMSREDAAYFKKKVNEIQKRKENGDAISKSQANRQLGYLSIMAYSFSTRALTYQQAELAEHFCAIYQAVDATNPEWAYLTACAKMLGNNTTEAMNALNEAVRLGFADRNRMMNEPLFSQLMKNPDFQTLMQKIKGN